MYIYLKVTHCILKKVFNFREDVRKILQLKQELFNKTIYNNNNKEKKTQWGKKRNTSPPIKVFFFFGWLLFLTCFRFL